MNCNSADFGIYFCKAGVSYTERDNRMEHSQVPD